MRTPASTDPKAARPVSPHKLCRLRRKLRILAGALTASLLVMSMSAGSSWASPTTLYVAPSGSDSVACSANSEAAPFATIERAVACSANGDVISLAPSVGKPYPGIGTVSDEVEIEAQPGANAFAVLIAADETLGEKKDGGLVVPPGGVVTLSGVTVECVHSPFCGGDEPEPSVLNEGTLTLRGDTVSHNDSFRGAVVNKGATTSVAPASLTIEDSTISENDGVDGAGVFSEVPAGGKGLLTIANSTIAHNRASDSGGGIYISGGGAMITNTTIAGNTAVSSAGGLWSNTPTQLLNTIVAGNTAHLDSDCKSAFPLDGGKLETEPEPGHNLIGNGNECHVADGVNGDQVGTATSPIDPGFVTAAETIAGKEVVQPALAANGGPTDTIALRAASPAIGAGEPQQCLSEAIAGLDQRGDSRNASSRGCDLGAYDTGGSAAAPVGTLFVAPDGSDSVACSANSSSAPFASIQRAVACSADGDVISLAPSAGNPYPGIGTVSDEIVIEAQPGANARSVVIAAEPAPGEKADRGLVVPPGGFVTLSGVTLTCLKVPFCAGNEPEPSVLNEGTLTLLGDTVSRNQSFKDGVVNRAVKGSAQMASLTIEDSTISENVGADGAGVLSEVAVGATSTALLTIANSTIADNTATNSGGGVYVGSGSATITNTTIAGNRASTSAGGLWAAGPTQLVDTILAGNTARLGPDCKSAYPLDGGKVEGEAELGHNLIGSGNECLLANGVNGDQVGTPASPIQSGLAPLAFNGGPTETMPPLAGSLAIGAGDASVCTGPPIAGLDQRGEERHSGTRGSCDVGAADTGGTAPAQTPPSITPAGSGQLTALTPASLTVGSATGAPTPALTETGALPSGVVFLDNGDGTGRFVGTPLAGTAGSYPVTITASNGVGAAAVESYTLTVVNLTVSKLKPATLLPGTKKTVTVTGTGFEPGATVASSAPGVTFSSVKVKSSTTLTAAVMVPAGASLGSYEVTVALPGTQAGCAGCLTLALPPTLEALSPATVAQGTTGAVVTITGNGFVSPVKVAFSGPGGGVKATVTSVTATAVTLKLSAALTAPVGSYTLKLTNGNGLTATLAGALTVTPVSGG